MIYSLDVLKNSNVNSNNTSKDTNFFYEAINMSSARYSYLINELDKMNLDNGNVEDNFIDKIKRYDPSITLNDMFDLFKSNVNALEDDLNKTLIKSNKRLSKYNSLGINTTYNIAIINCINNSLDTLTTVLQKMDSDNVNEYHNYMNSLEDRIRGLLINRDPISIDDFGDELFVVFRNNTDSSDKIISNYYIESISRENSKFIETMTNVIDRVNSFNMNIQIEDKNMLLYNSLVTNYVKFINNICSIYLLYLGAKIDCIKELCNGSIEYEDYEYSFKYASYVSEKEYYNDIDNLMNYMILNESISLKYINEGLADAVTKYISKVTNSAQQAWNKFKKKVDRQKDKEILKKIRPSIIKFKQTDFVVDNYPNFDMNSLQNLKLIPINYNTMKDDLTSREKFMKRYYSHIDFENKVSVKKAVKRFLLRNTVKRLELTRDFLIEKFNFNSKEYYNMIDSVEKDLEMINKSNGMITKLSSSILPATESVNFKSVYESILLEAPTMYNDPKKSTTMTFSTRDGKELQKGRKVANSSYLRKINVYMDVMAGIVTGKMSVLNEEYHNNMQILTMVYNRTGGGVMITNKDGTPKVNIEL